MNSFSCLFTLFGSMQLRLVRKSHSISNLWPWHRTAPVTWAMHHTNKMRRCRHIRGPNAKLHDDNSKCEQENMPNEPNTDCGLKATVTLVCTVCSVRVWMWAHHAKLWSKPICHTLCFLWLLLFCWYTHDNDCKQSDTERAWAIKKIAFMYERVHTTHVCLYCLYIKCD